MNIFESIEKWSSRKILESVVLKTKYNPRYVSVRDKELDLAFNSDYAKKLIDEIIGKGFHRIGAIRLDNKTVKWNQDILENVFLSDSGEIICALVLSKVAGLTKHYIELISETNSGIFIVDVMVESNEGRNILSKTSQKIFKQTSVLSLNINQSLISHSKLQSEFSENGFRTYSNIGDACEVSKKIYKVDLIEKLNEMAANFSHIKWFYKISIKSKERKYLSEKILEIKNQYELSN
jgi:hypothetical protein